MILVRFRQTFRERFAEWGCAAGQTGWGAIVLTSPGLFGRPFYHPLDAMAAQSTWGVGALAIGIMRLVVLFINGAWWRTPQFRQIGCMFGMLVWSGLLAGSLSIDWKSPSSAVYTMLFIFEACSLSFAAADGKASAMAQRNGAMAYEHG